MVKKLYSKKSNISYTPIYWYLYVYKNFLNANSANEKSFYLSFHFYSFISYSLQHPISHISRISHLNHFCMLLCDQTYSISYSIYTDPKNHLDLVWKILCFYFGSQRSVITATTISHGSQRPIVQWHLHRNDLLFCN